MTSPSDTNPFSPSDISIPSGGSRILSESYTDTGPGGADLSLSELSIASPSIHYKPFNIITAVNPRAQAHRDIIEDEDSFQPDRTVLSNDTTEAEHEGDQTPTAEETHAVNSSEKTREEKLQNDLFVLKKINASLGAYHEALLSTRSSTDRVAEQLEQTEALLNKYMAILTKSEEFSRLIFDERWEGAQKDDEVLARERKEARRKARQEAEERALALKREQEREEQERLAREGKERAEKLRNENVGGVRGVRGTRASMRRTRGSRGDTSVRGHAPSSSISRVTPGRS